jgi:hypothetical protein
VTEFLEVVLISSGEETSLFFVASKEFPKFRETQIFPPQKKEKENGS